MCMGCPEGYPGQCCVHLFVSCRHISPQFQFSLSAVTQSIYLGGSFHGLFVGLVVPGLENLVLPWLLTSAQYKIFPSPYTASINLSPSPSKLGRMSCWVTCLLVYVFLRDPCLQKERTLLREEESNAKVNRKGRICVSLLCGLVEGISSVMLELVYSVYMTVKCESATNQLPSKTKIKKKKTFPAHLRYSLLDLVTIPPLPTAPVGTNHKKLYSACASMTVCVPYDLPFLPVDLPPPLPTTNIGNESCDLQGSRSVWQPPSYQFPAISAIHFQELWHPETAALSSSVVF